MTEHIDVVVVGAGIAGISAAWHLQDRCPSKSYTILERRSRLGGTWDLFKYPGVRSDSDMYSLGFRFRPWREPKAVAEGSSILNYLRETVETYGIDRHIRYGHEVVGIDWSSAESRWTVYIDHDGQRRTLTCSFLIVCAGYYNYDRGYTPRFPGQEDFAGPVIHPQHWPEGFDHTGRRIVVIGSGATAVTLIPALANSGAGHVTMLQRSPSYIVRIPETDKLALRLHKYLPSSLASIIVRWKNVLYLAFIYRLCRRYPQKMRRLFLKGVKAQLPNGFDVEKHFTPSYDPWDQRMCFVPRGDLFYSIRHGHADVVTDKIERFTPKGILLASGQELAADVIVTATGLNIQLFGGASVSVDGTPVDLSKGMSYKGMMLSGLPNLIYTVGYTNASWTLKADLVSEFACRLINYLDARGYDTVVAEHPGDAVEEAPFIDFSAGYVVRALDRLPKQGTRKPWRLNQNYLRDVLLIRYGRVAERSLKFSRRPAVAKAA